MEKLKIGIKIEDQTVFGLETIFLHLSVVGQQQQLELESIFQYELLAVPTSLKDECGYLRKDNKSIMAKRLGVLQHNAPPPDTIIVNAQQLLYHITWPHGGDV